MDESATDKGSSVGDWRATCPWVAVDKGPVHVLGAGDSLDPYATFVVRAGAECSWDTLHPTW